MRSKLLKLIIVAIAIGTLPFIVSTCTSRSTPTTFGAEIPTPVTLRFVEPTDARIDFTSIKQPGASASTSKVVNIGDDVTDLIDAGPLFFDDVIDGFLVPATESISDLAIPTDVNTTHFETSIIFSTTTGYLAGLHDVIIDFGDFDYDNDGATEQCSGNNAQLPVCVRFWLDNERYLAWVFEEFQV